MILYVRILVVIVFSVGVITIYFARNEEKQETISNEIISMENFNGKELKVSGGAGKSPRSRYLISSDQCKMVDLDPWDASVRKYLIKPRPLVCSNVPPLTYVDRLENSTNVLVVNKENYSRYRINANHSVTCCYSLITRANQQATKYNSSADDSFLLSKCKYFEDRVSLPNDADYIFIKCLKYEKGKKNGKEIYKNVHFVISKLSDTYKKTLKKAGEAKKKRPRLNVIILGIDSVSKLSFRRIMPRTAKYLKNKNWVQLMGYNKIGDNTFPNLMAVLSGEPMERLDFWWRNKSKKMDDCPSIWKDFNAAGYATLYAEDTPLISTFNFMRTGFVEKPTDYYMRPFMVAAHELLPVKKLNGLPVCTGPALVLDNMLNYAKAFFEAFNDTNHFSLLWTNSLSHNDLNAPKALDNSVYKFLLEISHLDIYENSAVIILSDHGVRFGSIRETFTGYIEERQPFIFMWLPRWFRDEHPDAYANLLINQKRLTTPYDVFLTLKALLRGLTGEGSRGSDDSSFGCPKCSHLFRVQPLERSCSDAGVSLNWCLCSEFKRLDINEPTVVQAARFVYDYIVNRTRELVEQLKIKQGLCSTWKLSRIYRSQEIIEQSFEKRPLLNKIEEPKSEKRIIVVIVELSPGFTKYEATVQTFSSAIERTSFNFLEYPKRLDGIYKTSKCVKNPRLKYYCYCVRQ